MGDLLNFTPERGLTFDPDRGLAFAPERELQFNPGRALEFKPERDLGFGRRGVVFRGYVCPMCGSLVTEDVPRCAECGAEFEGTQRAPGPTVPAAPSRPEARSAPRDARTAGSTPKGPKAAATDKFCAFCGVKLSAKDAFCWSCGARTVGSAESVRLPATKRGPVTREWRGPQER